MNLQLPGSLTWVFLVSIFDAAVLSWLALRWYRGSVRKLMRERGSDAAATFQVEPPELPRSPTGPVSAPLAFAFFSARSTRAPWRAPLRRDLVVAYAFGAAAYSIIITVLQIGWEAPSLAWTAWPALWWTNAWLVVPALVVLLALDWRESARLTAGYVAIGAVMLSLLTLVGQILRGSVDSAPLTNVFWFLAGFAFNVSIPLALIVVTGWRRVRAVTPIALAGTLIFGFALMLFRDALTEAFNAAAFRETLLGLAALSSTEIAYYGLFMLVSLPIGWIAWRLLRALGAGFERKAFSDVQLIVDCWWLVGTTERISTLSTQYGLGAVFGGALAFAAYRTTVAFVLRTPREETKVAPRRLLLLRVFGYDARTEALFDRVAQRWRFHGPVQLIAGIDLATRTIDPGDILAFLRGGLAEQYVARPSEVAERIARLDLHPDPDGRFRVNEVYCHDDTWRPALETLLEASDSVLMDLRSFSARNEGCIFELRQLLRRVRSDAIVLVVDHTTDVQRLGEILSEAWAAAVQEGRGRGDGQVALVRVERNSALELDVLMARLLGALAPQRVLNVREIAGAFT